MNQWIHNAVQALEHDTVCAIIVIAQVIGSSPREPGTRMVVTRSNTYGTIGGGALEYRAIAHVRKRLGKHRSGREMLRWVLGPVTTKGGLGQCCGGVVWLLVEIVVAPIPDWLQCLAAVSVWHGERSVLTITMATCCSGDGDGGHLLLGVHTDRRGTLGSASADREAMQALQQLKTGSVVLNEAMCAGHLLLEDLTPTAPTVVLFGGGHVGSALVKVLHPLWLPIRWIDSRVKMLPEHVPPTVQAITTGVPEEEVNNASEGSLFLVMTHQHALDYRLIVKIFQRHDARFCGLIGSASKRLKAESELRRAGFSKARIAQQLTCPIGISGIGAKQPTAIAIAIAAQLLTLFGALCSTGDAHTKHRKRVGVAEGNIGKSTVGHAVEVAVPRMAITHNKDLY